MRCYHGSGERFRNIQKYPEIFPVKISKVIYNKLQVIFAGQFLHNGIISVPLKYIFFVIIHEIER